MSDNMSRLNKQPKYKIGQQVIVQIKTEHKPSGKWFMVRVPGYITGIKAAGTSEADTYLYTIADDIPGCYYSGKPAFAEIYEDDIVLYSNQDIAKEVKK